MAHPLIMRIVASSVAISHRAGRIIRDVMNKGDLGIVEKGIKDLQTEADRSAQSCIMASLHNKFPGLSLYGEEDSDAQAKVQADWVEKGQLDDVLSYSSKLPEELKNVKQDEIVVWIDPLDGTAEYTQGLLDHVTVLIGIAVKGKAVAGVIYQPYYNYKTEGAKLGRAIWGVIGIGSFGFEKRDPPEGRVITTTRSHSTKIVERTIDACEPTDILKVGGAGHKVLLILEGQAHAYVFASPFCKKWDTCAPEAVLHAAGGKLTDLSGKTYEYHAKVERLNSGGVLAVPVAEDHAWYADKIPEDVIEMLKVMVSSKTSKR